MFIYWGYNFNYTSRKSINEVKVALNLRVDVKECFSTGKLTFNFRYCNKNWVIYTYTQLSHPSPRPTSPLGTIIFPCHHFLWEKKENPEKTQQNFWKLVENCWWFLLKCDEIWWFELLTSKVGGIVAVAAPVYPTNWNLHETPLCRPYYWIKIYNINNVFVEEINM